MATPAAQARGISCVAHPSVSCPAGYFVVFACNSLWPVSVFAASGIEHFFVRTSADRRTKCWATFVGCSRVDVVVRSYVCSPLPSLSVRLLRRCWLTLSGGDVTHCHIVLQRHSPGSHSQEGCVCVWGGEFLLSPRCNVPPKKHLCFISTHFIPSSSY